MTGLAALFCLIAMGSLFGWGFTLGQNFQMEDEIVHLQAEIARLDDLDDYEG